jgi:hypothetical protein
MMAMKRQIGNKAKLNIKQKSLHIQRYTGFLLRQQQL